MNDVLEYLRRLILQPVDELTRAQRVLRFWVDLGRYGARQLTKDRAMEMAASLTFRTIFSLIPVVVLSMLVFRAFIDEQQVSRWVKEELNQVYEFLGFSALVADPDYAGPLAEETSQQGKDSAPDTDPVEAPLPTPSESGEAASQTGEPLPPDERVKPADTAANAPRTNQPDEPLPVPEADKGLESTSPQAAEQLRVSLDDKIDELVQRAWKTNLGNVGVVGILLFVWAALALLVSVEDSFNVIFDCPSSRRWLSRITIYWTALTLGPVLILAGLYLANQLTRWSAELHTGGWFVETLIRLASNVATLVASWVLLTVMYVLIPNTRVRISSALFGALVAAVLWEFAKWFFQLYVYKALPYSALYGSLALVPLFLYWLYITWLIVLFGLELTAILQNMRGHTLEEQEKLRHSQRLMCDPQWFVPLMARVATAFREGQTVDIDDLSQHLELPRMTVISMTNRLEEAGFLHKVGRTADSNRLALARPPEQIAIRDLLALGRKVSKHDMDHLDGADWRFVRKLMLSQEETAGDMTLADLTEPSLAGSSNGHPHHREKKA